MPSNIEIKASVGDIDELRRRASEIATEPGFNLRQEDIFFHAPNGRLKLRIFDDGSGQLIRYRRADGTEAKRSDYEIYETSQPQLLRSVLAESLGEKVVVRKKREVLMADQTRIHLDLVDGLGTFMELEVVMRPDQSSEEGQAIANDLMGKLGIDKKDLISCAYADLILAQRPS